MEMITGDVTGVAETPQVGEAIPDRVALALLMATALDLVCGGANTPGEVGREARVGFRFFAQRTRGSLLVRRWRLPSAPPRP
jgi:hypothetical protein